MRPRGSSRVTQRQPAATGKRACWPRRRAGGTTCVSMTLFAAPHQLRRRASAGLSGLSGLAAIRHGATGAKPIDNSSERSRACATSYLARFMPESCTLSFLQPSGWARGASQFREQVASSASAQSHTTCTEQLPTAPCHTTTRAGRQGATASGNADHHGACGRKGQAVSGELQCLGFAHLPAFLRESTETRVALAADVTSRR